MCVIIPIKPQSLEEIEKPKRPLMQDLGRCLRPLNIFLILNKPISQNLGKIIFLVLNSCILIYSKSSMSTKGGKAPTAGSVRMGCIGIYRKNVINRKFNTRVTFIVYTEIKCFFMEFKSFKRFLRLIYFFKFHIFLFSSLSKIT